MIYGCIAYALVGFAVMFLVMMADAADDIAPHHQTDVLSAFAAGVFWPIVAAGGVLMLCLYGLAEAADFVVGKER